MDDDIVLRRTLARAMRRRGYDVVDTAGLSGGQVAIVDVRPQLAIFELVLADGSGLELLRTLSQMRSDARAVILTGYGSVSAAVAAAKQGAVDFIAKPADADSIEASLTGKPLQSLEHHVLLTPEEQEFYYLLTMYEQHDRNMSETARAIGMHRRTLQRILRRRGIAAAPRAAVDPPSSKLRALRLYRLWTRLLAGHVQTGSAREGSAGDDLLTSAADAPGRRASARR